MQRRRWTPPKSRQGRRQALGSRDFEPWDAIGAELRDLFETLPHRPEYLNHKQAAQQREAVEAARERVA